MNLNGLFKKFGKEIVLEHDLDFLNELFWELLLVEAEISDGAYRTVISNCYLNKVIKIEIQKHTYTNTQEWNNWDILKNNYSYEDFTKFYSECNCISNYGTILIQEKVIPIQSFSELELICPSKVPYAFYLDDNHINNFGYRENQDGTRQLVCFDYSNSELISWLDRGWITKKEFLDYMKVNDYTINRELLPETLIEKVEKDRDRLNVREYDE